MKNSKSKNVCVTKYFQFYKIENKIKNITNSKTSAYLFLTKLKEPMAERDAQERARRQAQAEVEARARNPDNVPPRRDERTVAEEKSAPPTQPAPTPRQKRAVPLASTQSRAPPTQEELTAEQIGRDVDTSDMHVSLVDKIIRKPNPKKPIPDHICAQWHPTKNGKWKPTNFSRGSGYHATWYCGKKELCGCYHVWDTPICNRTAKKPRGCPWCAGQKRCEHMMTETFSLQAKFPEIAKQFHPTKNGDLQPNQLSAHSNESVWWLCPNKCDMGCPHEYQTMVSNKTKGQGCPFSGCCPNPKKSCIHTSLQTTHPEIVKYWDTEKNKDDNGTIILPEHVTHGSNFMAHWKCPKTCIEGCSHTWKATVASTVREKECDICLYCSGQKICPHTSLQYLYPDIAKEWHPTKNVNEFGIVISVEQVFPMSGQKAWWICPNPCQFGCVHEYEMIIANRTDKNQNCPYSGCCTTAPKQLCVHKSLKYLYPELASQWHPIKNSTTPDKVLPFCNDKAWWICKDNKDHEWEAGISDRNLTGCPYCYQYKSENETRMIFEKITGKAFHKKKSVFANNRWELDGYNDELKIAFEQQGIQHYEYRPHFHRNGIVDLEEQQKRDESKRKQCIELGIKLIEVSYLLTGSEKETYIQGQLSYLLQ